MGIKAMKTYYRIFLSALLALGVTACGSSDTDKKTGLTAAEILGNPEYLAMSYGGYRETDRSTVPTVAQIKDDMKILSAMGVKIVRTYNTELAEASRLLEAITELKAQDPNYEMYVMLGAWIECEGAFTDSPNHSLPNQAGNDAEIARAIDMVNAYPDIIKVIAVGNEAMVKWATSYYVLPSVILDQVNYLQSLKASGGIPAETWITSSDNFASWGGGAGSYRTGNLEALVEAVDYVSIHTYPFHDTHYAPGVFWPSPAEEDGYTDIQKVDAAMLRTKDYAIDQYQAVSDYITGLGSDKVIHIGESGWSTLNDGFYGPNGSNAANEYMAKLYHDHMREWTNEQGIALFYFEAFDEQWKGGNNPLDSEKHFGLFTLAGEAKFALWDLVDAGAFDGLTRDGLAITKSFGGDEALMHANQPLAEEEVETPDSITGINQSRTPGEAVNESILVILDESLVPDGSNDISYPSNIVQANAWEGTITMEITSEKVITIATGTGSWWGGSLEFFGSTGENLSEFSDGYLVFDIKGDTAASFDLGYQTGLWSSGNQADNFVTFGPNENYSISGEWTTVSIATSDLDSGAGLMDVTSMLYIRGVGEFDGGIVELKNISYRKVL